MALNDHDIKNTFSRTGGDRQHTNWHSGKKQDKPFLLVGVERDHPVARRFKLYLRNGGIYSFSYAMLPVIMFIPPKTLRIKMGEVEIEMTGRGLQKLESCFSDEQVTWIRESSSGIDDGSEEIFITSITIEE